MNFDFDKHEISTKALIFNQDRSKILIMEYAGGVAYGLPGGHIDAGETPWQAIRRELVEELGVDDDFKLVPAGFFVRDSEHEAPLVILGYLGATVEDSSLIYRSTDRGERALWMTRAEVDMLGNFAPGYRQFVADHWP